MGRVDIALLAARNDVDIPLPPGSQQWPTMYVEPEGPSAARELALPRPFSVPMCNNTTQPPFLTCPAGVANEWD